MLSVPRIATDPFSGVRTESRRLKYSRKRFQYLIKEKDVEDMTRELEKLNLSMDRLLTNTSILHPQKSIQEFRIIPDERKATALVSILEQIQIYTDRLFEAFCSVWVPGCHSSHDVALFLDTPVFSIPDYPRLKARSFKFRMMLGGKPVDVTMSSSWHEANVTVLEEDGSVTQAL